MIKFFSLFISIIIGSQASLAAVAESNIWLERRRLSSKNKPAPAPQLAVFPNSNSFGDRDEPLPKNLASLLAAFPQSHSRINQIHVSPKPEAPTVVLVQDIHMNVEAQTNIARVLENLIRENHIDLVGVEGAFSPFKFSRFRSFPEKEIVKKVADDFLSKKDMAAPSYVGITLRLRSGQALPSFMGVDDSTHYDANVKAYLDSRSIMEKTKERLFQLKRALAVQKSTVFNPSLKEWDALESSYAEKKISFGPYLKKLVRFLERTDSSPRSGEARLARRSFSEDGRGKILQFLEAYRLEQSINFRQVEIERRHVLEKLTKKLNENEIQNLVNQSLAHRMGKITFATFYHNLKALCDDHEISLEKTPAFDQFIQYILLSGGIKANQLFNEVQDHREKIYKTLARTTEEKELVSQSRWTRLAEKLIRFELTPKEWKEYKSLPAQFSLVSFENFYHQADIRSEKIVDNLLRHGKSRMFLLTGGFHSPHITQLLKEKDVSVIVASPKLTKVNAESGSAYLNVFAQEKTPLNKLFTGKKLFISPSFISSLSTFDGRATIRESRALRNMTTEHQLARDDDRDPPSLIKKIGYGGLVFMAFSFYVYASLGIIRLFSPFVAGFPILIIGTKIAVALLSGSLAMLLAQYWEQLGVNKKFTVNWRRLGMRMLASGIFTVWFGFLIFDLFFPFAGGYLSSLPVLVRGAILSGFLQIVLVPLIFDPAFFYLTSFVVEGRKHQEIVADMRSRIVHFTALTMVWFTVVNFLALIFFYDPQVAFLTNRAGVFLWIIVVSVFLGKKPGQATKKFQDVKGFKLLLLRLVLPFLWLHSGVRSILQIVLGPLFKSSFSGIYTLSVMYWLTAFVVTGAVGLYSPAYTFFLLGGSLFLWTGLLFLFGNRLIVPVDSENNSWEPSYIKPPKSVTLMKKMKRFVWLVNGRSKKSRYYLKFKLGRKREVLGYFLAQYFRVRIPGFTLFDLERATVPGGMRTEWEEDLNDAFRDKSIVDPENLRGAIGLLAEDIHAAPLGDLKNRSQAGFAEIMVLSAFSDLGDFDLREHHNITKRESKNGVEFILFDLEDVFSPLPLKLRMHRAILDEGLPFLTLEDLERAIERAENMPWEVFQFMLFESGFATENIESQWRPKFEELKRDVRRRIVFDLTYNYQGEQANSPNGIRARTFAEALLKEGPPAPRDGIETSGLTVWVARHIITPVLGRWFGRFRVQGVTDDDKEQDLFRIASTQVAPWFELMVGLTGGGIALGLLSITSSLSLFWMLFFAILSSALTFAGLHLATGRLVRSDEAPGKLAYQPSFGSRAPPFKGKIWNFVQDIYFDFKFNVLIYIVLLLIPTLTDPFSFGFFSLSLSLSILLSFLTHQDHNLNQGVVGQVRPYDPENPKNEIVEGFLRTLEVYYRSTSPLSFLAGNEEDINIIEILLEKAQRIDLRLPRYVKALDGYLTGDGKKRSNEESFDGLVKTLDSLDYFLVSMGYSVTMNDSSEIRWDRIKQVHEISNKGRVGVVAELERGSRDNFLHPPRGRGGQYGMGKVFLKESENGLLGDTLIPLMNMWSTGIRVDSADPLNRVARDLIERDLRKIGLTNNEIGDFRRLGQLWVDNMANIIGTALRARSEEQFVPYDLDILEELVEGAFVRNARRIFKRVTQAYAWSASIHEAVHFFFPATGEDRTYYAQLFSPVFGIVLLGSMSLLHNKKEGDKNRLEKQSALNVASVLWSGYGLPGKFTPDLDGLTKLLQKALEKPVSESLAILQKGPLGDSVPTYVGTRWTPSFSSRLKDVLIQLPVIGAVLVLGRWIVRLRAYRYVGLILAFFFLTGLAGSELLAFMVMVPISLPTLRPKDFQKASTIDETIDALLALASTKEKALTGQQIDDLLGINPGGLMQTIESVAGLDALPALSLQNTRPFTEKQFTQRLRKRLKEYAVDPNFSLADLALLMQRLVRLGIRPESLDVVMKEALKDVRTVTIVVNAKEDEEKVRALLPYLNETHSILIIAPPGQEGVYLKMIGQWKALLMTRGVAAETLRPTGVMPRSPQIINEHGRVVLESVDEALQKTIGATLRQSLLVLPEGLDIDPTSLTPGRLKQLKILYLNAIEETLQGRFMDIRAVRNIGRITRALLRSA